jgi:hypothetical protein
MKSLVLFFLHQRRQKKLIIRRSITTPHHTTSQNMTYLRIPVPTSVLPQLTWLRPALPLPPLISLASSRFPCLLSFPLPPLVSLVLLSFPLSSSQWSFPSSDLFPPVTSARGLVDRCRMSATVHMQPVVGDPVRRYHSIHTLLLVL